jgi:hypothetical protein
MKINKTSKAAIENEQYKLVNFHREGKIQRNWNTNLSLCNV